MNLLTMVKMLAEGMGRSILIYLLTLLGALPLGLLVVFGRMSKITPLRLVVKFYTQCVPLFYSAFFQKYKH